VEQTVVVLGATGVIGATVTRRLAAHGWTVIGGSRDPAAAKRAGLPVARWLAYEDPALLDALAACGRAISLSGHNPLSGRWTASFKEEMRRSRVATAALAAAGLSRRGGGVHVRASGINVLAPGGEQVVDDEAPKGTGYLPEMLTEVERAAASHPGRTVNIRIGLSFGRTGDPLTFLEKPFRLGVGGHLADGAHFVPWIHEQDLAGMFEAALTDERWSGGFVACAPQPERQRDVSLAIAARLGARSWLHAPRFACRLLMGEMSDLVLASFRGFPSKALGLGFGFRFPEFGGALADLRPRAA
jgi:hypothetical protein